MRMIGSKWENPNWSTSRLTEIEGVPSRRSVKPGMAFYSGPGPLGTTCGSCRNLCDKRCAKFRELACRRGEVVNPRNPSCKYFETKGRR
jgi:hypothetical protein